jgi:Zn finger protein HypA/HybF involved in hydrogenase expression
VDIKINKKIKNMATEAYCVKCKAKRNMKDEKEVEMNGKGGKKRSALKGTCPTCGTGMFKIMGMKK